MIQTNESETNKQHIIFVEKDWIIKLLSLVFLDSNYVPLYNMTRCDILLVHVYSFHL